MVSLIASCSLYLMYLHISLSRIHSKVLTLSKTTYSKLHHLYQCSTQGGGVGGGERLPYKRDKGARQKFWQEPLKGTKILLCGCGLKFISPLRGTNSKTKHISCHIFLAQYPKRYCKSFHCGSFEAEHPRYLGGTKTIPKPLFDP